MCCLRHRKVKGTCEIKMTHPFQFLDWSLRNQQKKPKLIRSVLKVIPRYSNIFKQCLLCLNEK